MHFQAIRIAQNGILGIMPLPRPMLSLAEKFLVSYARRKKMGGTANELQVAYYLRRQGLKVVAIDWHDEFLDGDIDMVAWDNKTLCFIEVKTRIDSDLAAETSVDDEKCKSLYRMAQAYMRSLPWETEEPGLKGLRWRFDIVILHPGNDRKPDIDWIQNAF